MELIKFDKDLTMAYQFWVKDEAVLGRWSLSILWRDMYPITPVRDGKHILCLIDILLSGKWTSGNS